MQSNILWSGIEYYSLENCIVDSNSGSVSIRSTILGLYLDKLYQVKYKIQLNPFWQTYYCLVEAQFDDEIKSFEFSKNEKEEWSLNGKYQPEFDGCLDVDIPLTPLTNSLPINRLQFKQNQEEKIDVVYIDLLENEIRRVKQKYQRISNEIYKYENIPNDFEAEIKVDNLGFVIDYPQLFKRTIRISSNYR